MGKFIRNLFIYTPVAIIFYVLMISLAYIFLPFYMTKNIMVVDGEVSGFLDQRIREIESFNKNQSIDILVFGSSHAYRGYDPRIFEKAGISLFNLGSSAQTPVQTEVLIKEYIEKIKPKFVIIDVYPVLFSIDELESDLDFVSNYKLTPELTFYILKKLDIRLINSLIARGARNLLGDKIKPYDPNNQDTYISGGYVENNRVLSPSMNFNKKNLIFLEMHKNAFKRIIGYLKKRKVEFILVQSPIIEAQYETFNNIELDQYFNGFNVPYLNFNKILELDINNFRDPSHLNQSGVEIFNDTLISILDDNKLLP